MKNKSKKAIYSLTLAFGLVSGGGIYANDNIDESDVFGVWRNDKIGSIDIKHCHNDKAKYCGYLKSIDKDLSKQFNLYVDSANESNNLVIENLRPTHKDKLSYTGKIVNVKGFLASIAKVKITYREENIANVKISVSFISLNYKFNRVKPSKEAPNISKFPTLPKK